jgi:hypothetical protein
MSQTTIQSRKQEARSRKQEETPETGIHFFFLPGFLLPAFPS